MRILKYLKRLRGFICGLIVGAAGVTMVFSAAASGGIKSAVFNSNKVILDGKELYLNGQQMVSIVKDGDINMANFMPVRGVLEAMGYTVDWDGVKKSVIVTSNYNAESTVIDAKNMPAYNVWLNTQKQQLANAAVEIKKLTNKQAVESACVKLATGQV